MNGVQRGKCSNSITVGYRKRRVRHYEAIRIERSYVYNKSFFAKVKEKNMVRKFVCAGILGRVLVFGMLIFGMALTGCATSGTAANADPFQVQGTGKAAFIVRVGTVENVRFARGDNLKINGVSVAFESLELVGYGISGASLASNELTLPIAPSYEFKFRVTMGNRGIGGNLNAIAGRADIVYAFEPDKKYLVNIEEAGGSKAGAFFLGGLAPASFKIVLYEYTSDLSERTKREEFPVEKLKDKEF
jgi:hypothetical protein